MLSILILETLPGEWQLIKHQVFAIMTLFAWVGFIQFLRYFKPTRILTAYAKASLGAMIPFLPIVFILLMAFSLTFWIHESAFYLGHGLDCDEECLELDHNLSDDYIQGHELGDYFENQYMLMFGDFANFKNRDAFSLTLLLLATLIVPLVFLNLLIALISEAFAIVSENLIRSDYSELTDIILELEEFMFWNKRKASSSHLLVAKTEANQAIVWTGRSNKVTQKVKGELDKLEKKVLFG
jgi:hypothetical protein